MPPNLPSAACSRKLLTSDEESTNEDVATMRKSMKQRRNTYVSEQNAEVTRNKHTAVLS